MRRTLAVPVRQAIKVSCLRTVGLWGATIAILAACGAGPRSDVAVPGAPTGGDTRPSISAIADPTTSVPSTTTVITATTSTTVSATTSTEPTTTVSSETTVPPTTTELVFVDEPAEGTLKFGVKGPRSKQLQGDLITLGLLPTGADDGLFGPGTAGGVRRFQEDSNLTVDGVAGPITLAALASAIASFDADF
jgi:hypothetical protein